MAEINVRFQPRVKITVRPQNRITITTAKQGPAGPSGTSGADISPAADNQLTERPDGLYVPPPDSLALSSTNW